MKVSVHLISSGAWSVLPMCLTVRVVWVKKCEIWYDLREITALNIDMIASKPKCIYAWI